jgi:hypothetical protein
MTTSEPPGNPPASRARLTQRLFPDGVPRLWCPTLSHFTAAGQFDEPRLRHHWQHLVPCVKGVLVPGSTGEGWEMSDADIQRLLAIVLDVAKATDIRVLIGVLKTDLPRVLQANSPSHSMARREFIATGAGLSAAMALGSLPGASAAPATQSPSRLTCIGNDLQIAADATEAQIAQTLGRCTLLPVGEAGGRVNARWRRASFRAPSQDSGRRDGGLALGMVPGQRGLRSASGGACSRWPRPSRSWARRACRRVAAASRPGAVP